MLLEGAISVGATEESIIEHYSFSLSGHAFDDAARAELGARGSWKDFGLRVESSTTPLGARAVTSIPSVRVTPRRCLGCAAFAGETYLLLLDGTVANVDVFEASNRELMPDDDGRFMHCTALARRILSTVDAGSRSLRRADGKVKLGLPQEGLQMFADLPADFVVGVDLRHLETPVETVQMLRVNRVFAPDRIGPIMDVWVSHQTEATPSVQPPVAVPGRLLGVESTWTMREAYEEGKVARWMEADVGYSLSSPCNPFRPDRGCASLSVRIASSTNLSSRDELMHIASTIVVEGAR